MNQPWNLYAQMPAPACVSHPLTQQHPPPSHPLSTIHPAEAKTTTLHQKPNTKDGGVVESEDWQLLGYQPLTTGLDRSSGKWSEWVLELPVKQRKEMMKAYNLPADATDEAGHTIKYASRRFKQNRAQREYLRKAQEKTQKVKVGSLDKAHRRTANSTPFLDISLHE
jgi:hypothetical protein